MRSFSWIGAELVQLTCLLDGEPSAAMADGLKPLAISHTAMTISCTASGAMKNPSESPNMLPSGATM